MITAPAARSIVTTVASRDGARPACSTEPFSVGMSGSVDDVLEADRHAVQRPDGRPDASARVCRRSGLRQRVQDRGTPRLDAVVDLPHALQARADELLLS